MTAEQVVYTQLSAYAPLMALASTISPGIAKQGCVLPYVTFHIYGDAIDNSHDGPDTYRYPSVQIDCWGSSFDSARATCDAVCAALFVSDSPPNWFFIVEDGGQYSFEEETRLHRFMVQARVYFK